MVASTERIASQIGVDVMKRGGNAVDAAVAVAFALAVVYPVAGNLGGGGFMMIRRSDGTATAIDYRETAPATATRDMYIRPDGELIKGEGSSLLGYRASGVPGTVAGMAFALRKYGSGKLTWSALIEPAKKLAVDGFVVTHRTEKGLELLQIEAFENIEHLDQDRAAGGRRRHRNDPESPITSAERHALFRRVIAQILACDQAAVVLHILGNQLRRFAFVEVARPFLLETSKRVGQFRLPQNLSLAIQLPLPQKNPAAICERRKDSLIVLQPFLCPMRHHEAVDG